VCSGSHSLVFFVLQRLGPPGLLPVKPGGSISGSSFLVNSFFCSSLKLEVYPTWWSAPESSYKPNNNGPTTLPFEAYLKPPTTQSAVRMRFTFCMPSRSSARQGRSRRFAITPSSFIPEVESHLRASDRFLVFGDSSILWFFARYF